MKLKGGLQERIQILGSGSRNQIFKMCDSVDLRYPERTKHVQLEHNVPLSSLHVQSYQVNEVVAHAPGSQIRYHDNASVIQSQLYVLFCCWYLSYAHTSCMCSWARLVFLPKGTRNHSRSRGGSLNFNLKLRNGWLNENANWSNSKNTEIRLFGFYLLGICNCFPLKEEELSELLLKWRMPTLQVLRQREFDRQQRAQQHAELVSFDLWWSFAYCISHWLWCAVQLEAIPTPLPPTPLQVQFAQVKLLFWMSF